MLKRSLEKVAKNSHIFRFRFLPDNYLLLDLFQKFWVLPIPFIRYTEKGDGPYNDR